MRPPSSCSTAWCTGTPQTARSRRVAGHMALVAARLHLHFLLRVLCSACCPLVSLPPACFRASSLHPLARNPSLGSRLARCRCACWPLLGMLWPMAAAFPLAGCCADSACPLPVPPALPLQVVVLNQVLAADVNVGYEEVVNTQVGG